MRAAEFRYEVSVKRSAGTPDSYGYTATTWQTVATHRCVREVQNSNRTLSNGELWYPNAAVFTFRLGANVQLGDRIQDGNSLYDVISCTPDRLKRIITVNAELHNE